MPGLFGQKVLRASLYNIRETVPNSILQRIAVMAQVDGFGLVFQGNPISLRL
jgi:hypothetical protein